MTYTPTKWVNGGKPAINAENLNKIEEALAQLSVPDITTTTSTTQPNSYAGREMVLEIGGKTEQDSTTGKNLLHNTATTQTINGGTFTINEDKSITVNGTFTATTFLRIGGMSLKGGQSYILSGCPSGGSASSYLISLRNENNSSAYTNDTGSGAPYTPSADITAYPTIRIQSGTSMNHTFYPMIRLASVADATYEPFTNGPAPNPSYPMEIKKSVVSGVKTHWKNFWSYGDIPYGTQAGISWNIPSGTYTFSCVASTIDLTLRVYFADGTSKVIAIAQTPTTFTLENDVFSFNYNSIKEDTITNIQVEEGTVATEYEPYTESSYTFSQPIELYGMGGVQDIITPQPIKRRFTSFVFNGSEDWKASSSLTSRYYLDNTGCAQSGKVLCSQAKGVSYSTNVNECYLNRSGSVNGRFFINTDFASVDEWKAHLVENPMTVVFELAEETTEALPIADQIGLNSLATYDGITYVEFIYDELEPTFRGKYGTSEVGGMTLESLLTARNNAL